MPQRFWSHSCPGYGQHIKSTERICRLCGAEGKNAGWSISTHEAMAQYVKLYRVAPIGPHRPMATKLFNEVTRFCGLCHGRGYYSSGSSERWTECLACEGMGRYFTVSPEEREAIRQRILGAFPDARVDRPNESL